MHFEFRIQVTAFSYTNTVGQSVVYVNIISCIVIQVCEGIAVYLPKSSILHINECI